MDLVLHDITATAGKDEHSPEFRAGLERLGWRVLGRVRLGTQEQLIEWATEYDPSLAPALLEKELIGGTVMRNAEGTAFAFVDWFFTCPYTRVMTILDDGQLVETHEAWTANPLLQLDLQHIHLFMHRRREQTRNEAEGRYVELVDEPTPASLVDAHRQHVTRITERAGSRPQSHASLGQAMDLWDQQFAHSWAVSNRTGRLAGILPGAAMLPVQLALLGVIGWRAFEDGGLGFFLISALILTIVLPVAVAHFLASRLFTPLGYVRSIKPAFYGRPLGAKKVADGPQ